MVLSCTSIWDSVVCGITNLTCGISPTTLCKATCLLNLRLPPQAFWAEQHYRFFLLALQNWGHQRNYKLRGSIFGVSIESRTQELQVIQLSLYNRSIQSKQISCGKHVWFPIGENSKRISVVMPENLAAHMFGPQIFVNSLAPILKSSEENSLFESRSRIFMSGPFPYLANSKTLHTDVYKNGRHHHPRIFLTEEILVPMTLGIPQIHKSFESKQPIDTKAIAKLLSMYW